MLQSFRFQQEDTLDEPFCRQCGREVEALPLFQWAHTNFYDDALRAAERGEFLEALTNCAAATRWSNNGDPWILLGELLGRQGLTASASECFAKAAALGVISPDIPSPPVEKIVAELRPDPETVRKSSKLNWSIGRGSGLPIQTVAGAVVAAFLSGYLTLVVMDGIGPKAPPAQVAPVSTSRQAVVEPQAAAPRPSAPAPAPETRIHVVKSGESLWKIASKELGAGYSWREIWSVNCGSIDPNLKLNVGARVRIPVRPAVAPQSAGSSCGTVAGNDHLTGVGVRSTGSHQKPFDRQPLGHRSQHHQALAVGHGGDAGRSPASAVDGMIDDEPRRTASYGPRKPASHAGAGGRSRFATDGPVVSRGPTGDRADGI